MNGSPGKPHGRLFGAVHEAAPIRGNSIVSPVAFCLLEGQHLAAFRRRLHGLGYLGGGPLRSLASRVFFQVRVALRRTRLSVAEYLADNGGYCFLRKNTLRLVLHSPNPHVRWRLLLFWTL